MSDESRDFIRERYRSSSKNPKNAKMRKVELYFNEDKSCIFNCCYLFSYNEPYNFSFTKTTLIKSFEVHWFTNLFEIENGEKAIVNRNDQGLRTLFRYRGKSEIVLEKKSAACVVIRYVFTL